MVHWTLEYSPCSLRNKTLLMLWSPRLPRYNSSISLEATALFSFLFALSVPPYACAPKACIVLHDFDLWAIQVVMDESHVALNEAGKLQEPHDAERLRPGQ